MRLILMMLVVAGVCWNDTQAQYNSYRLSEKAPLSEADDQLFDRLQLVSKANDGLPVALRMTFTFSEYSEMANACSWLNAQNYFAIHDESAPQTGEHEEFVCLLFQEVEISDRSQTTLIIESAREMVKTYGGTKANGRCTYA